MAEVYRPSLDDPNAWVPYRYHPSRIAAIVFAVLFAITTAFHIFQLIRRRTWYFIPLVVGGLFEVVGYIGRILSTNDLWALGPYIMQSLLLLVAPALFAASIYMILGRIILLTDGERHSLVPRKWLTKVFVIGDVVSFLVQGGGGGIQAAGTLELLHTGEKIIIVGLFIQLAFFGFFITVAGLFHYRLRRHENIPSLEARNHENGSSPEAIEFQQLSSFGSSAADHTSKSSNLPWKRHIFALYVASTFIMIRSIFRVVEYLQGNNGYLLRHEVFLYIFDAALMFGVMCLFNLVHPAQVTDLYHHRTAESARNGYSS